MMGHEIRKLRQSFQYAVRGVRLCVGTERNFRIHLTAACYVTFFAVLCRLPGIKCAVLALCFGVMMGAELMNSAVERLCVWKAAGYVRTVREAKEIAAGSGVLGALGCAVIGLLFFVPALPQILAGLRSHPALILFLILSAPCAIWFIFRFGRKR